MCINHSNDISRVELSCPSKFFAVLNFESLFDLIQEIVGQLNKQINLEL